MRRWQTIDRVPTSDGTLELRQRGERDFLILIDDRVLMSSTAFRSEVFLAEAACRLLADRAAPRVLIGGLGMGLTLRAALDALPAQALVHVVELNSEVVRWCGGALAPVCGDALADARTRLEVDDVAAVIARIGREGPPYDAVIIDLFEGPHAATQSADDPFYGPTAIERVRSALRPDGVFAVWGEDPDRRFESRLGRAGFEFERTLTGKGGRRHAVYIARPGPRQAARKLASATPRPRPKRR